MYNYLQAFISLFCIMNPLLSITIYLSITKGMDHVQKRLVLTVCGVTVFTILILCILIGQKIMEVLGIHQYSLQLAGGLIVLLIGITTILKKDNTSVNSEANKYDRSTAISQGVSPLALPMIVGPGSMVLTMLYAQQSPSITSKLLLAGVILIVTISVSLVLSLSDFISKLMGELGVLVMTKVMGLLLTAIAFEMLISGIKSILPILLTH